MRCVPAAGYLKASLALACLLVICASAPAADVAGLAAGLGSEQYSQREEAEKRLLDEGLKCIDRVFDDVVLPAQTRDVDVQQHFEKIAAQVQAALQKILFRHLEGLEDLESRYRAERVREAIQREVQIRLSRLQAGFPQRLPEEAASQVHGYTGGFRDGTTWFDTEFTNDSSYTVTSIRILVRLTNRRTGEKIERQTVLGKLNEPLLPGASVEWSVDVGVKMEDDHEYFWDKLAVYGTPPEPEAAPSP